MFLDFGMMYSKAADLDCCIVVSRHLQNLKSIAVFHVQTFLLDND